MAPTSSASRKNSASVAAIATELFPAKVIVAELEQDGDPALLYPEERQYLGDAAPRRIGEFSAGRLCARRAMAEFGVRAFPLHMADDLRPRWPSNLIGSITHAGRYCAAAVGERSCFRAIGFDAQTIDRVSADTWPRFCAPAELAWLRTLAASERNEVAALMLSGKEAFYKCQFELTGQKLDCTDISLDLMGGELGAGVFVVRPLVKLAFPESPPHPFSGRFRLHEGRALAGMVIAAAESGEKQEPRRRSKNFADSTAE